MNFLRVGNIKYNPLCLKKITLGYECLKLIQTSIIMKIIKLIVFIFFVNTAFSKEMANIKADKSNLEIERKIYGNMANMTNGMLLYKGFRIGDPTIKKNKVQNKVTISGNITDSFGMPLFGVNIIIKGTNKGTQTDINGHYTIDANKGDILVYSYVGMHTQEIIIKDVSTIDVILYENTEALKEVVVNAVKISKEERSKSYASTVITSDKLLKGGYTNIFQALQGTVAGYSGGLIRGGTTLGGTPPLFVVDGVPTDASFVESIIINDVEKVEVIKSASQSLRYGPRAVGGVIIVTTKFHNDFLEGNIGNSKTNVEVSKYQGSLQVDESIKDKLYINELSKAKSAEEAYSIYVQQKDQYDHLPAYYLDVYNYFKKRNDRNLGLKILFNDLTTNHNNPEQLKALAYHLEAGKEYQLAINIYTQVLRLFPEDFQSYRDLALVYKEIGLIQESKTILNSLKSSESNSSNNVLQFLTIDDILRNDTIDFEGERLSRAYDVRIVVDWNSIDANINLQVIDPTREICNYENPTTKQRGQLAQNMSQGFGPEEFTLTKGKKGSYFVMINYTTSNDTKKNNPTFLKLSMFKNYGKSNETKEVKVIRLEEIVENYIVAELKL